MKTADLRRQQAIKIDLMEAVPQDATIVETRPDGIVCEETVEVELNKVPVRDENGDVVMREAPGGQFTYPEMRRVTEEQTRRYLLEKRRTGRTVKNYDFQEDEATRQARETRKKRDAVLDLLADQLAESDLSAEESVRRLLEARAGETGATDEGSLSGPDAEDVGGGKPTVTAHGRTATMNSPGRWTMPDGEVIEGTKDEARLILEEVYGEEADA